MPEGRTLAGLAAAAAQTAPDQVAIREPSGATVSYGALAALARQVAAYLTALGVRPGDRVGVCLPKSADAVAAILGTLEAGAAYVPLDRTAPVHRTGFIVQDCAARVVVVEDGLADKLIAAVDQRGDTPPAMVRVGRSNAGAGLRAALASSASPPLPPATLPTHPGLACLLYTSGSTGKPKGVMLTHDNILAFVDWCSATFAPTAQDCFASHAPFHFDLSTHDLYVALKHGAQIALVDEDVGRQPAALTEFIATAGISVWYSVPSILALLVQFGKMTRFAYPALRCVLFAGEVFPIAQLQRLQALWPQPRYFNLYGPTETNVCTFFEATVDVTRARRAPLPIGRPCAQLRTQVVDEAGAPVAPGREGELCVQGPNVMPGYWNLPEQTAAAFLPTADGGRWYRTGDLVCEQADGSYLFRGRRDRMVKRRGYRIELGEIEAALSSHPEVIEVAVLAPPDEDGGLRIRAVLHSRTKVSLIALKRFCAETLPSYMIPDDFEIGAPLPRTATGKTDYLALAARGGGGEAAHGLRADG